MSVVRALCRVNKEWCAELVPRLKETCRAHFAMAAPGLVDMLEHHTAVRFEEVLSRCEINLVQLLSVLDKFPKVYQRNKGQRYQHWLRPLTNRSLFLDKDDNVDNADNVDNDPTRRNECVTYTTIFLFVLLGYVQQQYPTSAASAHSVDVMFWCMYLTYDYLFHIYTSLPLEHPILHTPLFKHTLMWNIHYIRTLNFRTHMGPTLSYHMERMMQKIEYVMFYEE